MIIIMIASVAAKNTFGDALPTHHTQHETIKEISGASFSTSITKIAPLVCCLLLECRTLPAELWETAFCHHNNIDVSW